MQTGLGFVIGTLLLAQACDTKEAADTTKVVLDLKELTSNPDSYEWFDFRPNVKKLILSGAAETEHVAILWYTTEDGGVGLHYHAKTESVFVIDGTQTDAKGVYPTGSMYFNPPGSGHEITNSSGLFILAYAAPPDFTKADQIGEYTPTRLDTRSDVLRDLPFEEKQSGVRVHAVALDAVGGMSAELFAIESGSYTYEGNYVLVLDGSCDIDGVTQAASKLVVAKTTQPQTYKVSAAPSGRCLALGVSF